MSRLNTSSSTVIDFKLSADLPAQSDALLFQDQFPLLLHNDLIVKKHNIFKYLKKICKKGLYKPKDKVKAM